MLTIERIPDVNPYFGGGLPHGHHFLCPACEKAALRKYPHIPNTYQCESYACMTIVTAEMVEHYRAQQVVEAVN